MGRFREKQSEKYMKNNLKSSDPHFVANEVILDSVKAVCGVSYTCFTGTQVLGQFGEIEREYPKSCPETHEK